MLLYLVAIRPMERLAIANSQLATEGGMAGGPMGGSFGAYGLGMDRVGRGGYSGGTIVTTPAIFGQSGYSAGPSMLTAPQPAFARSTRRVCRF